MKYTSTALSDHIPIICCCRTTWVKVNGTKYRTPCALVIGRTEEEDPMFGYVYSVLVSGQEVFFEFEEMEVTFCQHFHAYAVTLPLSSRQHFLIKQKDLINYHPYGLYHCPSISSNTCNIQYVVLRNNIYAP